MNLNSYHIVMYDSFFIYGLEDKNLKIPKTRYENKIKHLQNLNVFNMNDARNLLDNKNSKILFTQYRPLSFNGALTRTRTANLLITNLQVRYIILSIIIDNKG